MTFDEDEVTAIIARPMKMSAKLWLGGVPRTGVHSTRGGELLVTIDPKAKQFCVTSNAGDEGRDEIAGELWRFPNHVTD